jgi:hypothetical protein
MTIKASWKECGLQPGHCMRVLSTQPKSELSDGKGTQGIQACHEQGRGGNVTIIISILQDFDGFIFISRILMDSCH